ncbi:MAG: peptidyl-alpha-hydroxyglycine alpha-amidating lyase family protein [Fuerstiella sp.]|nr:peptidyl-alpha-hydroxyglycine alpha-amidating lyase family protein [Fuerstiella sp.]
MKFSNIITAVSFFAITGATFSETVPAGEKYGFTPVTDFVQVPDNITLDACSGVSVNSNGFVYLAHRGQRPIICFDSKGRYVRSWGDDFIGSAHGLRIDSDDNVWVTDTEKHAVFKFSPSGKLLLSIGRLGSAGLANDQFNKPADVAFGAHGQIYVADGYGNSRVMKFSAEGRFLTSWGVPGTGPGEFNLPHTIVTASDGRVIVGDRMNNRIQVFDADGTHLEIWDGFTPFGLEFDCDGFLWVAEGKNHKLLRLGQSGAVLQSWGGPGNGLGEFDVPHMLAADEAGNLYVAEILNKRLQKLTRIP